MMGSQRRTSAKRAARQKPESENRGGSMQCQICREPAEAVVLFRKEEKSKTGYLVLGNSVSFERERIAKFIYYCQSKGLSLKKRGMIDLCSDCIREAKIHLN